jgi:hypothetical protein
MEIGPQLPNYLKKLDDPSDSCHDDSGNKELQIALDKCEHDTGAYGPKLPPRNKHKVETKPHRDSQCDHVDINAPVPESTCNDTVVSELDCPIDGDDLYGPALPPNFIRKSTTIIGPCRPQPGNTTGKIVLKV